MITRRVLKRLARFGSQKIYDRQQCVQMISSTTSMVEKVAEITLGPYGRNVLIQNQMQSPRITKDGVTVVKHIEFVENRMQNAIATLIKKSVDGTNKYAGDGTTTSTVLIGQIMRIAYKKIATGANVRDIRKGFQIGRKISLQFLEACSRKIQKKQQLMNVAMISTNGKEDIASLVVDAIYNSEKVRVQKSQKQENSVEYHSGVTVPRGIEFKQFANTTLQKVIYNYPLVVTSLLPLNNVKEVVQALELAKKARKQIIFFAPDFSDSVKSTLIYNNKKKILECSCVSFPEYGDKPKQLLKNISAIAQSFLFEQFSEDKIQKIEWRHLGKAVKIQSDMFETKLEVSDEARNKNVEAVIMVGGPNQTVMLQNYDHIIDALNSTKSAKKDGIIAGGGVTFWRLSELLQSYVGQGEDGVKILAQALKQPRIKLMQYIPGEKNPLSGSVWEGFDLKRGKIIDMFQAGIVDSVNVAKSVIIDSLSLCTVLVQVERGLANTDKKITQVTLKELNRQFRL